MARKKKSPAATVRQRIGDRVRGQSHTDFDALEQLERDREARLAIEQADPGASLAEITGEAERGGFLERLASAREGLAERFDPTVERLGKRVAEPVSRIIRGIGGGVRRFGREAVGSARAVRGAIGSALGLPRTREEFGEAGRVALRRGLTGIKAGLALPADAEPGLLSAAVGGLAGLGADIESERALAAKGREEKRAETKLRISEFKALKDFRIVDPEFADAPGVFETTIPTSGRKVFVKRKPGAFERFALATSKEARAARESELKTLKERLKKAEDDVLGSFNKKEGRRIGGLRSEFGVASPEFREGLQEIRRLEFDRVDLDPTFKDSDIRQIKERPGGLLEFLKIKKRGLRLGPGLRGISDQDAVELSRIGAKVKAGKSLSDSEFRFMREKKRQAKGAGTE